MVESVKNIVNIILKDSEYLLIDVEIRGEKKNKVIDIFVDSRSKLDLDKLSDLNREIWDKIEENGLNEQFSKITVSSPGIERSFKYIEQLPKHIGREIELKLKDGAGISGTLVNVNEKEGIIEIRMKNSKKSIQDNKINILEFNKIKESKIKLKF